MIDLLLARSGETLVTPLLLLLPELPLARLFGYYGYRRNGILFLLLMVILGIGLVYNSVRVICTREGMYDADSTSLTQWINMLCIGGGSALALWAGWRLYEIFAGIA